MPAVEIIPQADGVPLARVTIGSAALTSDTNTRPNMLKLLREVSKGTEGVNRYLPGGTECDGIQIERARTAFRRLLNTIRNPALYEKPFRGCQQIGVEFCDLSSATIGRYLPAKVPDVISVYHQKLAEWRDRHPVSRVPEELLSAWEEVRNREAHRWQRALDLHAAGYSLKDIRSELVREYADGRGDIHGWARGTLVPWLFKNVIKTPARQAAFDRQRLEDPQSAYVLGALATSAKSHQAAYRVQSQDRDVAEHLMKIVENTLKISCTFKEAPERSGLISYHVTFQRQEFSSHLWRETGAQQYVPWQLLTSSDHEKAYARAILDLNSGVTFKVASGKRYPLVELTFTRREEFVDEIQILFARVGITGSLSYDAKTRVSRIEFSGGLTLDAIQQLGFTAKRKSDRLTAEQNLTIRKLREYTTEDYNDIMRQLSAGVPVRTIARVTGINRDAVKSWKDGSKPDLVKRFERIQAILERRVAPETIRFLMAEKGLNALSARTFARNSHLFSTDRNTAETTDNSGYSSRAENSGPSLMFSNYSQFLELASRYPVLSYEEQRELLALKDSDSVARDKLVLHNLRLALSVVRRYAPVHLRQNMDLIQSTTIKLIDAVKHIDIERISEHTGKPVRFASYAYTAMQRQLWKELAAHGSFEMTVENHKVLKKLYAAESRLRSRGAIVDQETIMAESGLSENQYQKAVRIRRLLKSVSLDAPMGDLDGPTLAASVAQPNSSPAITRQTELEEFRSVANKAFDALGFDLRTREILFLRFGFVSEDGAQQAFKDLAARYGISRARVQQIYDHAIRTIRENIDLRLVKQMILQLEADS